MTAAVTVDECRRVDLFADLDDRQLAWLADTGRAVELADREVLFEEGGRATHFYVVLTGELIITKTIGGRSEIYGRRSAAVAAEPVPGVPADRSMAAHRFTGELPLLVGGDYVAGAEANGPTRLLALDRDGFFELLARCPQVWRVLLPAVAWRIRTFESQAGRRSMLEGLGTLAAGLAHELNNPSAVLLGAANQLWAAVGELAACATTWGELAVPDERRTLTTTVTALLAGDGTHKPADALAAAEAVDDVDDWLACHCGDDRPHGELAAILADQGVAVPALESLADNVRGSVLPVAIGFLSYSMHVRALVTDIEEAAARIAALVRSTKAYSNLDRAAQQQVDLVKGIEATLAMLAPKLSNVRIRRDYGDLPPVPGYPSELNQVWTNLIDNAVDAMGGDGELRLAVHQEAGCAVVEVGDNGSGVPPDVLPMLFRPFFSTKDIGRGTGLGLHLSRDVITQRHHGSIDVTSQPGNTTFTVRLPIRGVRDAS